MDIKTKIEREFRQGLRSDRKEIAKRAESFIQVENMGQYHIIPLTNTPIEVEKKEDLKDALIGAGLGLIAGVVIGKKVDKKEEPKDKGTTLYDDIEEEVRKSVRK